jgi:thiol-disulfide isomerase/thioredoxin
LLFLAAASSLLLLAEGSAAGPSWEKDWKRAFERARAEEKMVFIDFWADWCKPCRRMDSVTFPDHRVVAELSDFVLLKVDVDQTFVARAHGIQSFPTYSIFDQWEKERFRFSGFHEPEIFAFKIGLARRAAPAMVEAGWLLQEKESSSGFLLLGTAYLKAHSASDAREAFQRARKLASREGKTDVAQTAETQAALTWAIEGKAEKTLKLLEKIAAQPANAECEAGVWLAIGHARRTMKDSAAAAEAYRRALAACPENSPLRRDAEAALATISP